MVDEKRYIDEHCPESISKLVDAPMDYANEKLNRMKAY